MSVGIIRSHDDYAGEHAFEADVVVVGTGAGFVVAFVEKRLPARPELSMEERAAFEREVRVRVQRRGMERLARELLADARVVPMDRGLGWSWGQRGK